MKSIITVLLGVTLVTPGVSQAPIYYHPKVTCLAHEAGMNFNYRSSPSVVRRGGFIHQAQICKEV